MAFVKYLRHTAYFRIVAFVMWLWVVGFLAIDH
jgi:hypothetical protein